MKKYTFTIKNNPSTYYTPSYKSTDYSKILDDLIAADIAEKNPWLFTCDNCPLNDTNKKIKIKINLKNNDPLEDVFAWGKKTYSYNNAFNFLANLAYDCPFEKDVKYHLSTGDYITITDDYIHINDKVYFFNLMNDEFFYNLGTDMKKTIATIYVAGLKITIKK